MISPIYSYDKLVLLAKIIKVSYAFNDSYILENPVGYCKIFPIGVTYMGVKGLLL